MRILVTNDDGIHAPGLVVAEKIARALSDDVWVVAPDDRTIRRFAFADADAALRLRGSTIERFAVIGHADRLRDDGVAELMEDALPTLVLSGVNRGFNIGRRRDLFGHHRRRDGRLRPRHSVYRAVAVLSVSTTGSDIALGLRCERTAPL